MHPDRYDEEVVLRLMLGKRTPAVTVDRIRKRLGLPAVVGSGERAIVAAPSREKRLG